MTSSYYPDPSDDRNDQDSPEPLRERTCQRCHGTGQDADGADCVYCQGWGSVISGY